MKSPSKYVYIKNMKGVLQYALQRHSDPVGDIPLYFSKESLGDTKYSVMWLPKLGWFNEAFHIAMLRIHGMGLEKYTERFVNDLYKRQGIKQAKLSNKPLLDPDFLAVGLEQMVVGVSLMLSSYAVASFLIIVRICFNKFK